MPSPREFSRSGKPSAVFLDDLYQSILLDHYQQPRHHRELTDGDATVTVDNPTCGDRLRLKLALRDGRLTVLETCCDGCAICTASTSMMAERLHGAAVADAEALIASVLAFVEDGGDAPDDLGDLRVFAGVREYPGRKACVTMAWSALAKWLATCDKQA